MTHRAETILTAIKTALTGLTTTGANVQRGRVYDIANVPALVIEKGSDSSVELKNSAFVDREITVIITAHVKATSGLETELNKINAEVYAALMSDRTLGLPFVISTDFIADEAPTIYSEGETPIATMESSFLIMYRHSVASVEG